MKNTKIIKQLLEKRERKILLKLMDSIGTCKASKLIKDLKLIQQQKQKL